MKGYKYSDIFIDHMSIARVKFIEKYNREPDLYEIIEFFNELFCLFYD